LARRQKKKSGKRGTGREEIPRSTLIERQWASVHEFPNHYPRQTVGGKNATPLDEKVGAEGKVRTVGKQGGDRKRPQKLDEGEVDVGQMETGNEVRHRKFHEDRTKSDEGNTSKIDREGSGNEDNFSQGTKCVS